MNFNTVYYLLFKAARFLLYCPMVQGGNDDKLRPIMATASLITYVDSNVNQEGESSNNLTLPLSEEERLLYYKKG